MNPKLHLSLDVKNLEESVRFYSVLFDAPPTKLKPGYARFDLDQPAVNLTMQQASHCCLQGLSHLGLRVDSTEEVLAVKQRLNAAGIQTRDEMNTTCCHALQDEIWLTDPTGYRWAVYVFQGDAEQPDASPNQPAAASACCGGNERSLP